MASYVDELSADRERIIKALRLLIQEQEQLVRDLAENLVEYRESLDRAIIRTMIYRNVYGPSQAQTMMAEKDAQDASRPVTETTIQLERESDILHVYRDSLKQVENGTPLSMALGRLT